jgi:hypothetical protein
MAANDCDFFGSDGHCLNAIQLTASLGGKFDTANESLIVKSYL